MAEESLSPQQAYVLVWLLDEYLHAPARLTRADLELIDHLGIPVEREPKLSRSESASLSRAIRRLSDRGLVERHNKHGGRYDYEYVVPTRGRYISRATHIRLTAEGWDLAERLTEKFGPAGSWSPRVNRGDA